MNEIPDRNVPTNFFDTKYFFNTYTQNAGMLLVMKGKFTIEKLKSYPAF